MTKTHHVRTVLTMEGNMKKEVTYLDGKLQRVKKTTMEWQNGALKPIQRDITKFNSGVGGMSKALNGAALRFIGLNALVSGASRAFQKLNQWVDTSVENFRKFENSMAEVSTILTGETLSAIGTLTLGVEELSIQYGQSAVDMSRGMYQILSAAVDVEKAINLLNTATKASIAGLTTVETSVDVLTSIINSYGKSVEQAANVSDVLFQTVVRGKLRFEDLASALGYITPIAAAAGVAFEEIAAALATVTRMGLHVDMATRGLALTIQNIVSPTKQAREAAEKFGVDMSAVGIRVFGLKGFIEDLSSAVKEFGLSVLPLMVRNMRSLRVVMALVSDEGIKGFAKDLDLMYASTGRTDEALAKMIKTQEREAAVVKQSQEIIQRSIGETWSPIKRNLEATKMWFASFLAGGFSIDFANKKIEALSETLDKNRNKMYESMEAMGKWGQQSIFTQLFSMDDYDESKINAAVAKVTDMGKVQDYLIAQSKALEPGTRGVNIFESAILDLEMLENSIKGGIINAQSPIFKEITSAAAEAFDFEEYKKGTHVLTYIADAISSVESAARDNITVMNDNVDAFNSFFSSIDMAREKVFNFKISILELQNAIANLSTEVSDIFTDLSGQEHAGTLGLEIDTKSFNTAVDRMKKFATMIKSYGSEWEEMFYNIFEGATFTMGGEEVSYIEEYNEELKDAVNTVYDFKEAQKEVKKVMNEVNKAIMLNNIAIAELQLAGMMRRRGLTRSEEKMIKKLQIENMKERLKAKKTEHEAMSDTDKQEYDEAAAQIKEYFDSQQFYLFLMKDARDDELDHMINTFGRKEDLLTHYQEALVIQEGYLQKAHQIEVDLLTWITEEFPTIADLYEEIYGVSIPESIQKSIDAMEEWQASQEDKTTSKDSNSGISARRSSAGIARTPKEVEVIRTIWRRKMMDEDWGFSRGTYSVPSEGDYHLHENEQVVPAGKQESGNSGVSIEHVTIQVKEIAEIGSAEKVAAVLARADRARLTKNGKTTFEVV